MVSYYLQSRYVLNIEFVFCVDDGVGKGQSSTTVTYKTDRESTRNRVNGDIRDHWSSQRKAFSKHPLLDCTGCF